MNTGDIPRASVPERLVFGIELCALLPGRTQVPAWLLPIRPHGSVSKRSKLDQIEAPGAASGPHAPPPLRGGLEIPLSTCRPDRRSVLDDPPGTRRLRL